MLKRLICILAAAILTFSLAGCAAPAKTVKIGVSFGVGSAIRWVKEKGFMEERAKELGIQLEARLNTTDKPKTQQQDCFELIDSGIDVLVLIPRDVNNVKEVIEYAKKKNVKVISYARVILGQKVDLFVGYDSTRIGQTLGQYLVEMVYQGDYIILQGDSGDNNAKLLYEGAMRMINPAKEKGDINIILDEHVPGWSADEAKKMVYDAVKANNNQIDAILAPNDKIAGACVEALAELGVTKHVAITGMDADIEAVQRILDGKQDVTVFMDLRDLAYTAIDEAYNMAAKKNVNVNAKFDNQSGGEGIDANLITGQLVTKQNIDKILIESGYFTKEEIYGAK